MEEGNVLASPVTASGALLIQPARLIPVATQIGEHSYSSPCDDEPLKKKLAMAETGKELLECENIEMESPKEDEDGFTTVTYRKNRASGIPVIFKPTTAELSFWKANPNRVAAEIVAAINEKVLSSRINKDGSFCVGVNSLLSAQKLLELKTLAGIPINALIPESYMKTLGKIKDVPIEYSDEDLLEYLKERGVIAVRRQRTWKVNEDGSTSMRPLPNVFLQFVRTNLCHIVFLWALQCTRLKQYIEPAIRCYKCQRYGHIARTCRGTLRCKTCSGPHDYKECLTKRQPKCANCGGPHPASFSRCPRSKWASHLQREKILNGTQDRQQRPLPNYEWVSRTAHNQRGLDQNARHDLYSSILKGQKITSDRRGKIPRNGPSPSAPPSPPDATTTKEVPRLENVVPPQTVPHTATDSIQRRQMMPTPPSDFNQLLLRMLFMALKAILHALPQANNLLEVKTLLEMEQVIMHGGHGIPLNG
ncbi:hypothetical protein HPB48_007532 [Haemaphysalis longicornis]|uniref:CCHC-type domain-containing protein n=1 Tax=Haemaphysalis longicornis TaxID=44386 RepID=A0A9J6FWH9_HAELO|nr:hypothetical protein HPB48_007532 [Haemaphysalis longicornis]